MIISYADAIERVAARAVKNHKDIQRKNKQRRHNVVDMYGVEYTRQGDGGSPARFYISISPDMVYLERFEFKLIIQPFVSTVQSGTQSAVVNVNPTNLSVNNDTITPNPHDHTTDAHSHNVVAGISQVSTTASDFRVSIEGIDVTPYLAAQYDAWISGEGVYPSLEIGKDYDILEVASDLVAEGREEDADTLVKAGYKRIEITSASPFQVTLVNYLKYSHLNR